MGIKIRKEEAEMVTTTIQNFLKKQELKYEKQSIEDRKKSSVH